MSALTGIQIGPRQFELPPNIPVSGFARHIADAIRLAARVEDIRMLGMMARQCPDAELAEEFVFVEHPRQDAPKLGFIKDRTEPAASVAGLARIVNEARELRTRFKETLKALHDFGIFVPKFAFENGDRAERQQLIDILLTGVHLTITY